MHNPQPYRHSISSWEVAPCLLVPPVAVGAICLWRDLPLTPFLFTFALSCLALVVLVWPQQVLRLAMAGAVLTSLFLLAGAAG
jgi:hypothetical protein